MYIYMYRHTHILRMCDMHMPCIHALFKVCSCIPFSPSVVMDDTNIEVAARRIMWAKCVNVGQTCIAPDYVLCHSKVKERFIKGVKKSLTTFFKGEPEKSTDYGRIVNSNHFQSVLCSNTYVRTYVHTYLHSMIIHS